MSSVSLEKKALTTIVIVGGGISGLVTAYGLSRLPNSDDLYDIRVLEKRGYDEAAVTSGFPVHLTEDARNALKEILTPVDLKELEIYRRRFKCSHDGNTFLSDRGDVFWRFMISEGEYTMIGRQDLCDFFRRKCGVQVDYGRRVECIKDVENGAIAYLDDGDYIQADVVVGADGMFSGVRSSLFPGKNMVHRTKWTILNLRPSSTEIAEFVHDRHGLNVILGSSWTAMLGLAQKSGSNGQPVILALTVPYPVENARVAVDRLESSPFIDALREDPCLDKAETFNLWTGKKTIVGKGRVVLIGDASHGMVPFCGCGAGAGIRDAVELVKVLTQMEEIDQRIERFNKRSKSRNNKQLKLSRFLLWAVQGEVKWKRTIRDGVFTAVGAIGKLGGSGRLPRED